MKILFLLKSRSAYGSYGLINSCMFTGQMLVNRGFTVKVSQVVDANSIDREVALFRPDVVIIESLWVPPAKLQELVRLHPEQKWVVRIHSHSPFLATEGIAFDWLVEYRSQTPSVVLATNDDRMRRELDAGLQWFLKYLPNFYPFKVTKSLHDYRPGSLNIGCFGALRVMKNHAQQAVAALIFARLAGTGIKFHINVPENVADKNDSSVLKSLRAIFRNNPDGTLVEHKWLPHAEFLHIVQSMDAGMQVSFSETFNIIAADFVMNGIPIVTSPEVAWVNPECWANPTDAFDIAETLLQVLTNNENNRAFLERSNRKAVQHWAAFLNEK